MTSIKDFNRSALDASLNDVMDALANSEFGGLSVKSGRRSTVGNLLAGGAKKSQHLSGKALDIDISGLSNQQKAALLGIAVAHGIKGVGIYKSGKSLHIDTRRNPATWGPSKKGQYKGVDPSAQPAWAQSALKSMFTGSFPPAPSGPTGWPTPTEKGPGIYGALNPATLAEQYGLANTRYRQPVAATPLDQFRPEFGPPMSAMPAAPAPSRFAPEIAAPRMTTEEARSVFDKVLTPSPTPSLADAMRAAVRPQQGPPAPPQAAPTQARVGTPATPAPDRFGPEAPASERFGPAAPAPDRFGPVAAPQSSMPAVGAGMPVSPAGPYATATMPAAPVPTARPQQAAPAAAAAAYPDEGRFALQKGLTPADMEQMGLTPAPALTPRPAVKEAPVKEVPQQETVITAPPAVRTTVVPAPTIAPAAPPPAKPGGLIGALENLAAPLTARLTAPFHTLANLAGPVPNPPSRNIGTGSEAISGILGGLGQPGDTAYSRSNPGYSVKSLGNGMVQKTNEYGHVSFERVGTPGGIFTSNPGGLYSAHPSGLLSGFGLGGVPSTVGGLFSGGNLGGFAGSLLGGAVAGPFGALAGGWLGNKLGSGTGFGGTGFGNTANVGPHAFGYAGPWGSGTAPASTSVSGGGGLFGGWGGGGGGGLFGGGGGGGGSKKSGSSKSDSQKTDRADAAGYR